MSACQDSSVTHPDTVTPTSGLVGSWSGSIGSGTLELVFRSENKSLHGTATLTFGQNPPITYEFDSVQWDSPNQFRIELPCLFCTRILTGILIDESTLEGSYSEEYTASEGLDDVYMPWTAARHSN